MSSGNAFDAGFVASGEVARLEALAEDLRRLSDGRGPSAEELARAPLLLNYAVAFRAAPCLEGLAIGHPRLGNTDVITTQLWAYCPERNFARTLSRFYRLDSPRAPRCDNG
jgi:hypothetical protein